MHLRETRISNHGPLSWVTMLKRDPYLRCMWAKLVEYRKAKKMSTLIMMSANNAKDAPEEKVFRDKMLENEGLADIQPFDSNNKEEQINDESESDANNSSSDDNTARSKNSSSEIKDSSTGDSTKDQEESKLDKPNGFNSGSTDDTSYDHS
ncbi:unnamed protein product [[Candida] boidinii]|nr:unnamed protein product [[Candida] boidinii]